MPNILQRRLDRGFTLMLNNEEVLKDAFED